MILIPVICDLCSENYTNVNMCGGLVVAGYGICPRCTPKTLEAIKRYNEEHTINAKCPKDVPYNWFINLYRNGYKISQINNIK